MSRWAIFDALNEDSTLNDLGIQGSEAPLTLYQSYTLMVRPVEAPFVIMKWGRSPAPVFQDIDLKPVEAPTRLTICAHLPIELSNDGTVLDSILNACDDVLSQMEDVSGSDNRTVISIRLQGRSDDFLDDGFKTLYKEGGYDVLSRRN